MQKYYLANINIDSKGGVVAAPDLDTPGGSYYYHWMRDAGLTMRTYLEINDMDLSKVVDNMKAYTQWVLRVQNEVDPYDIDVRIEPKFQLPDGEVFTGSWCRPQTDGPALRSTPLIMFANLLLQDGQEDYVKQYLWTGNSDYNGGAIKYDLDWVVQHWTEEGCDLWEEVKSDNFFWNRMAFQYSLGLASEFAQKMGDSTSADQYKTTQKSIQDTLQGHWTGKFMEQSTNRQKDSAVIHAFSTLNGGYYTFDSPYIGGTIETLNNLFCISYSINQVDDNQSIPGILYGRYQGDSYAGGNPWQLLSSNLGELFYQLSDLYNKKSASGLVDSDIINAWKNVLNVTEDCTNGDFAKAAFLAGDAVLYRIYYHVKPEQGHVSEQIGRDSGKQLSAMDLTWSYANILRALHFRNKNLKNFI